jgi:hypothetical protein
MAVLVVACANKSVTVSYPEKFQGLTQLTLASLTKNVSFTEEINKRVFLFFRFARVAVTRRDLIFTRFCKKTLRVEFELDKASTFLHLRFA